MKNLPPQQPASQAWKGKDVILKIMGRKYLNSPEFTERFELAVDSITDPVSVSKAIRQSLEAVEGHTEIPPDLVSGVSFQFVSKTKP